MGYVERFFRNPLGRGQQDRLRKAEFAIVGLGGTGGFIFENLLRAGAERFTLFDHDRFELSNFNRQLLATEETLDWSKTEAAVARAKSINPVARIKTREHFDASAPIGRASLLLDGSDSVDTKIAMAALAKKKRIPYVFCSASGTRGIVTVFEKYDFKKAFGIRMQNSKQTQNTKPKPRRACQSIICPAAALAGTLAASQAINIAIGKPHVRAPEALFFDLFSEKIFWRAKLG